MKMKTQASWTYGIQQEQYNTKKKVESNIDLHQNTKKDLNNLALRNKRKNKKATGNDVYSC